MRVRVLILQDIALDADPMISELKGAGLEPDWAQVSTEPEFVAHLDGAYDLILADYQLPQLGGLRALQLVRARSDTPVILISTSAELEAALDAIRSGADDYLLRDRMSRLGPATRRALEQRRRRAEDERAWKALAVAEEKYRVLLETSMDAVIMVNDQGLIEYANYAVQTIFGYDPQDLAGCRSDMLQPGHLRSAQNEQFQHDLGFRPRALHRKPAEYVGLHRDRHEMPLEITFSDVQLGGRKMLSFFLRDISDRKLQQERIARLTRIHAVLSGINGAILRIRDAQELLDAACRIAVDHGDFGIVWIGRFDPRKSEVAVIASANLPAAALLEAARLPVDGAGSSPDGEVVARAVAEKSPVFVNDIGTGAYAGGALGKEAIGRGLRSVIALPLTDREEVKAVLVLFAKEVDFFDQDEVKLLTELADNISFGLAHVAREQKLEKLSRIRAVLGQVNAALVRVKDREELLRETCRIVSEHGRFELVWTALIDEDRQHVEPVAWAGFSRETATGVTWETLKALQVTLHEVLQTRRPAVRHDITDQPHGGVLRQEAVLRGCSSAVCLPFLIDGKVVAAINVFAPGAGFFDTDELALLSELTGDISFALHSMARQERLDYLAYYDPLTGLPNRQLFMDRVSLQTRSRGDEPVLVAVILFEIQRFRAINETLGRSGGDELLRQVAARVEAAFQGKDRLAHVGADRFGVVVRGIRDAAAAADVIEKRIFGCFGSAFLIGGEDVRVVARASAALYPVDGTDANTLFANAEAALKRAKSAAAPYLFYAAEMNAQAAQWRLLETKLRAAVDGRQFVLHYQPKIALATGAVCGLEALIRWQDPSSGLVPPCDFIPMLEETGLIVEVGQWAITQALTDHCAWTSRGCVVPRIAVNVSAIQLQQNDFADKVVEAVERASARPDVLELEVTESLLMRDLDTVIGKLSTLRQLGIHIAMDDFGTGYSSLSYLARLPINVVKIDRSFITGMADKAQDMAIVTTIIALARSLNLLVIAEGVETRQQLELLSQLGCDQAQGYLFSKPLPAAEIDHLLR
jgi:PAS domain S-box-containing protein/diguanylate cyclase (GGDEF)-like protein